MSTTGLGGWECETRVHPSLFVLIPRHFESAPCFLVKREVASIEPLSFYLKAPKRKTTRHPVSEDEADTSIPVTEAHSRATPTDAEIADLRTIQSIATWAGGEARSVEQPFLQILEQTAPKSRSPSPITTDVEWDALLAEVRVGEEGAKRPLTLMAKMTLRLFIRTARLVAGVDDVSNNYVSEYISSRLIPKSPAKEEQRTIKLSQVLDQSSDDTAPVLSPEAVKAFYAAYKAIFKRLPPPATECTVDQLSAVLFRLKSGVPPYEDFSVFGPYGSRLNRRLKMKGLQLRSDGELHTVEIFGPPGIHEWIKSFELLTTALVGFEAVSLGALLDYQGHIQELHDEHGLTTWSLLYQADVRCRLELMERIRRSLSPEDEADQPWDAVFRIAIEDQKFWRREFEKPALLVLTKAGRLNEFVDR